MYVHEGCFAITVQPGSGSALPIRKDDDQLEKDLNCIQTSDAESDIESSFLKSGFRHISQ